MTEKSQSKQEDDEEEKAPRPAAAARVLRRALVDARFLARNPLPGLLGIALVQVVDEGAVLAHPHVLLTPEDGLRDDADARHAEGVEGSGPTVFHVRWSPRPPANYTIMVDPDECQPRSL